MVSEGWGRNELKLVLVLLLNFFELDRRIKWDGTEPVPSLTKHRWLKMTWRAAIPRSRVCASAPLGWKIGRMELRKPFRTHQSFDRRLLTWRAPPLGTAEPLWGNVLFFGPGGVWRSNVQG